MKKCPFCATEIQDQAVFCPNCKKDLKPVEKNPILVCPYCGQNPYSAEGLLWMEKKCTKCGKTVIGIPREVMAALQSRAQNKKPVSYTGIVLTVLVVLFIGSVLAIRRGNNPPKPRLPIQVSYHRAFLNDSLIADFHNASKRKLSLLVKVINPVTNRTEKFQIEIAANKTKELGQSEGWTFSSGDLIEISNKDYQTSETKMP